MYVWSAMHANHFSCFCFIFFVARVYCHGSVFNRLWNPAIELERAVRGFWLFSCRTNIKNKIHIYNKAYLPTCWGAGQPRPGLESTLGLNCVIPNTIIYSLPRIPIPQNHTKNDVFREWWTALLRTKMKHIQGNCSSLGDFQSNSVHASDGWAKSAKCNIFQVQVTNPEAATNYSGCLKVFPRMIIFGISGICTITRAEHEDLPHIHISLYVYL